MINLPDNLPTDRRGIEEVLADIISGKTTPTTPTSDVTDPNFKFEPDLSVDYGGDYNFDKSAYENYMEATRTIEDREREDLEEGVKKAKRDIFFNKMGEMGEALGVSGASKDGTPTASIEGKIFSKVGASKVPQTRRFEDGGIASLMPMYMDDGGYASGFGFGNFGTDFTNPFLDDLDLTDEELNDYIEAIKDSYGAQNAANSITRADAYARGYGAPQADRIAEGTAPSKLNYEDTPSNILPGADIRIYARDENPAAYKFYPSEVSKLYSQMKGVPFSPLVAPPKEATYVDSLQPRRIQSQLYAKDGTYVNSTDEFPRRQELITGPGGERGDEIPAMLSDGEFVTNAAAVRGMGIMAGANPEDEYEQRLLGARQMYDYQRQAEEMAKRYA